MGLLGYPGIMSGRPTGSIYKRPRTQPNTANSYPGWPMKLRAHCKDYTHGKQSAEKNRQSAPSVSWNCLSHKGPSKNKLPLKILQFRPIIFPDPTGKANTLLSDLSSPDTHLANITFHNIFRPRDAIVPY
ncbi:hypothetical protein L873DRAFT_1805280 [Choiromyces venosus 120613-1]|uniref:Uncharacterized protein n=1 Tax=Choiromyces venosus 120613-1 TaxID=1336337 RepID=A0A3N4JQ76_9PEZI|nr:hypothetical protein L873DRAFT_1805280 [Choiromyces venosus 120613-1]